MSGGIAYVYARDLDFKTRCNTDMVAFEALDPEDKETIEKLLSAHLRYTHSSVAEVILRDLTIELRHFVKIMPLEYKRILESRRVKEKAELTEVSDG